MPTFAYSGRTRGGQAVSGERIAETVEAAVAGLRREQILVTKIDAVAGKAAARSAPGGRSVPSKNLSVFTRQFSVMIDAGLPLVQCLDILGKQEDDPHFAQVILQTRAEVEGGASLADAMRKFPKAFDPLYTNMIAAGEAGGILDTILKRLATYIEKSVKLKSQMKSAMIYPLAILSVAVVMVGVILWKVIPTFTELFKGMGAEMPLPTRVVIWLSEQLIIIAPLLLLAIGGLVFMLRGYHATPQGRRALDGLLLRLPIIGPVIRKVAVARFCRTLSTLLSSGVPILDGLEITATTAGNAVVEDAVRAARAGIERGETVSAPLRETQVFPSMVGQMINVGEATGALDTMLSKIADFYEEEVETAMAGLLTLIEPAMIAMVGVVVGVIVIAMYMPMFDLISQLSQ